MEAVITPEIVNASEHFIDAGCIRLDEWARINLSRHAESHRLSMSPECLRSFADLEEAISYAKYVGRFFANNGIRQTVFVIKPPAWVGGANYEVSTNTCGYTVFFSTDESVDIQLSLPQQRDVLYGALKALLDNQVQAWKTAGFTMDQIKAMPYLKPSFRAIELASR